MRHELRCWRPFFRAVMMGSKTFEVRRDDRGFMVGDTLALQEFDPVRERYTGRQLDRRVSFLLRGPQFGIEEGHVVMSLAEQPETTSEEP